MDSLRYFNPYVLDQAKLFDMSFFSLVYYQGLIGSIIYKTQGVICL